MSGQRSLGRTLLTLLLAAAPVLAGDGWLVGLSDGVRVRSMGGCFAATSGPEEAVLFNPAGLARISRNGGLGLELGPAAPLAFTASRSKGDWPWYDALRSLSLVRRLDVNGRHLTLALHPVEWLPTRTGALPATGEQARLASGELSTGLVAGLALDHRVRLGMSAMAWFDPQSERRRLGVSYGAIIRANRLTDVGGHATYLPTGAKDIRRPLDQIGDGTINVGIAWYPLGRAQEPVGRASLQVAMDVRNVTQESGLSGTQELHLGAEACVLGNLLLRGGISWPHSGSWSDGQPCPSGGAGWRSSLPWGSLRVDLGVMRNPADSRRRVWMGSLGWRL